MGGTHDRVDVLGEGRILADRFSATPALARHESFEAVLNAVTEDASWFQDLKRHPSSDRANSDAEQEFESEREADPFGIVERGLEALTCALEEVEEALQEPCSSPQEGAMAVEMQQIPDVSRREEGARVSLSGRFDIRHPRLGILSTTLSLERAGDPQTAALSVTIASSSRTLESLSPKRQSLLTGLERASGRSVNLALIDESDRVERPRDE